VSPTAVGSRRGSVDGHGGVAAQGDALQAASAGGTPSILSTHPGPSGGAANTPSPANTAAASSAATHAASLGRDSWGVASSTHSSSGGSPSAAATVRCLSLLRAAVLAAAIAQRDSGGDGGMAPAVAVVEQWTTDPCAVALTAEHLYQVATAWGYEGGTGDDVDSGAAAESFTVGQVVRGEVAVGTTMLGAGSSVTAAAAVGVLADVTRLLPVAVHASGSGVGGR